MEVNKKKCTVCGKIKVIEDFAWRNKSKGTTHPDCKVCHRKLRKAYYHKTNEKDKIIARNQARRQKTKEWLKEYKRELCCERCGEKRSVALQFHHSDPIKKEYNISTLVERAWSIDHIKKEIEKCEVICSNCHLEEHFGHLYK